MPKNRKPILMIDYQYFIILLVIAIFTACNPKKEQISQNVVAKQDSIWNNIELFKGETDYTLVYEQDSIRRVLSFRKSIDSVSFHYINYQTSQNKKLTLAEEVKFIDRLWRIAEDSIKISLKGIMVGYPLEYQDVLINQIEALKTIEPFEINQYDSLRSIMFKNHVYQPIENYLNKRGYQLTKISTEKHGYIPKEDLIKLGYSDSLKIPVPFMVWLEIEKRID